MKCGIINCAQGDNRFLWRCQGTCNRTFHAACIGVQRNHEEVLRTFMLPLCDECQDKFTTELSMNELATSFQHIKENIGHTLAANHKLLSNFKSLSATHDETLEHIEKMLGDIKQAISYVTSSSKTSATEIKNKLTALLDTPPADNYMAVEKAAKSAATAAVAEISTTTATTAHSIGLLPQVVAELKNDLLDSNAMLASEVKLHMEEMAKTLSAPSSHANKADEMLTNSEKAPSKWRLLGNKIVWKRDWTEYDARQRSRRLQEKAQEKARRRRKQRKGHRQENYNSNLNSNKYTQNNINNNNIDTTVNNNENRNFKNSIGTTTTLMNSTQAHTTLPLDKDLLAAARVQFSRSPNTDSRPTFINFQKGETINPYRTEISAETEHPPLLDPMRPPIVRLTQQSAAGDQRFLKGRLRDPKIMDIVRTYLSYLYDQSPAVCIRGITKTSATLMLAAEGLPTDTALLREIFLDVHEELGISRIDALADLQSHRAFLSSERTQRLQQIREAARKFYSPPHF